MNSQVYLIHTIWPKSWTQRWKVSTFAMEVKRSFFEMKMGALGPVISAWS